MKIVVVGAGAAGLAAATRAKRVSPQAQVVVFEKSGEYSRGTCSLPYFLSGEITEPRHLRGLSLQQLKDSGLELHLNTAAREIQAHQRRLLTDGPAVPYDRLIVATGSQARPNPFPDLDPKSPRVWKLKTLADAEKIQEDLQTSGLRSVAIVGGGYVGIELAEALSLRGLQVTLFHRQATLMRLRPEISQAVSEHLQTQGVRVECGSEVIKIRPEAGFQVEGISSEGSSFHSTFDAVALTHGIQPSVQLLAQAGASLGHSGAVTVTSRGETTLNQVYACGDGVEIPNSWGGPGRWIPLATTAARLGRVCGENAAGGSLRLGPNRGALSIRLFGKQLGVLGQARDWEESVPLAFQWGIPDHPFSRRNQGLGILFTHPGNQRITGLQAFGAEAASLVNLVSLATEQNMTLAELAEQDFSYTPPLGGLWHPLYLAQRAAQKGAERPFVGGVSR